MQRPSACIFDLDGVIVETADSHYKAWKRLADSLNIPFDEKANQALKGVSRSQSLQKILDIDNRSVSSQKFQQLMDKKNGWYQDYISQLSPGDILDGVLPFLKALTSMNVKLAIGSSSKNAQFILDYLELNDSFQAVIDGTKVQNTKPDPEVFLKAAQALNTQPSKCIVFEDAASGIEAAQVAGMISVGVGSPDYLSKADYVLQTFKDLTPEELFRLLDEL